MNDAITLENLKPSISLPKKITACLLFVTTVAVLVSSYLFVDMNPIKLIEKKDNAIVYLFGRQLTELDRKDAMSQAENMLRNIALEESRLEISKKYQDSDQKPSAMDIYKESELLVDEILSTKSETYKRDIVDNEYKSILSAKKGGFFPPDLSPVSLKSYGIGLIETIAMAIWGTLIAVAVAIPVSVFAAGNTLAILIQGDGAHHRAIRWFFHFIVRRYLDFCRGFNEFVMALIFVAIIGLGPFAGVLALAVHTFGILGKVFSEAIEAVEPGQVEAVVASGASNAQVITYSVFPQIMPLVVSYSLLRFESNVRSAAILGFCGAGGIGFLMFDKINSFEYREVSTMMVMIIVSVSILDFACGKLRRKFI